MRILVTGATGYIGGRLVRRLYEEGHLVRCFARAAHRLRGRFPQEVEVADGAIEDVAALKNALASCDVAYYLVHSMGSTSQFAAADHEAARVFGAAAKQAGLRLIVYLGGLGKSEEGLSAHLQSRREVGRLLRESGVPVIEFRAAQIIGSGSISFEMIRYLTERLPAMIAPRWVCTRCQPIGVRDVLSYLTGALRRPFETRIYEIGGADVETYRGMMLRYAEMRRLRRRIFIVPFFTPKLSSYWVHLVTPIPARIARPLVAGLYHEVIVRDDAARRDFPWIEPQSFGDALRLALDRSQSADRESTWFDAFSAETPKAEFSGLKEGMLIDRRRRIVGAPASQTAEIYSSLGGERGWLASNSLWRIRGWIDRIAGGTGLRRGRRSMKSLRVGDALDFWRVEEYREGRMLRLRAEMLLPGRAWLQFESEPLAAGKSTLVQSAFFEPRGLWGYVYWYAILPFHNVVFGRMMDEIVRAAEHA